MKQVTNTEPGRQETRQGKGFIPEGAADTEDQVTEYSGFTALSEFSSEVWLLLGASVLALIAAILFAKYYRKH